jgi:hypothetical protein
VLRELRLLLDDWLPVLTAFLGGLLGKHLSDIADGPHQPAVGVELRPPY